MSGAADEWESEQAHLMATRPSLYDLFIRVRAKVGMADVARYEVAESQGLPPEEVETVMVSMPVVVLSEFLEQVRLLWADYEDTTQRLSAEMRCPGSNRPLTKCIPHSVDGGRVWFGECGGCGEWMQSKHSTTADAMEHFKP